LISTVGTLISTVDRDKKMQIELPTKWNEKV